MSDDGAYIVASSDPSQGKDSFKVIATQKDLLDYPACSYADNIFGGAVWDMTAFNGKLYISVVTGLASTVRYQCHTWHCEQEQEDRNITHHLVQQRRQIHIGRYGSGADRRGNVGVQRHSIETADEQLQRGPAVAGLHT